MAFGISFGKKKQSSTSDTDINKTETGTQSGLEGTQSFQQSNTSGLTNTSGSSSGSSSTTQQNQQTGVTTSDILSSGSTSSFSGETARGIEDSISQLLAGINESGAIVGQGVSGLQNFDPAAFVNGILSQASSRVNSDLEASLNGLFDRIGGGSGDNSIAALLSQRLTGDAAANLAGVEAQAQGQAQDILRNNVLGTSQALASVNQFGPDLINALKGGNVTTTQQQTGQQTENVNQVGTSNTLTAEQQQQQQATSQQTTQQLVQLISQLLNTTNQTVGTESNVTKGKQGGFGAGLSI